MSCQLLIDGPPSGVQPAFAAATRRRRLPPLVRTQVRPFTLHHVWLLTE